MDYSSETSLCTVAPSPTDTPCPIFSEGRGGWTQARHIGLCKADRTTWKLTLQDNNTTPKEPKTERGRHGRSRRQLFECQFCTQATETDDPSSNCPSKLTDKVRRIVHSKLKPFHFQIKTYYLSDANYQTDNPSHPNNPPLVWKRPFLL